jgi:hypothetical protein
MESGNSTSAGATSIARPSVKSAGPKIGAGGENMLALNPAWQSRNQIGLPLAKTQRRQKDKTIILYGTWRAWRLGENIRIQDASCVARFAQMEKIFKHSSAKRFLGYLIEFQIHHLETSRF